MAVWLVVAGQLLLLLGIATWDLQNVRDNRDDRMMDAKTHKASKKATDSI